MTITELKQKIQEITDEISELSLDDFAEINKELYELDDEVTQKHMAAKNHIWFSVTPDIRRDSRGAEPRTPFYF